MYTDCIEEKLSILSISINYMLLTFQTDHDKDADQSGNSYGRKDVKTQKVTWRQRLRREISEDQDFVYLDRRSLQVCACLCVCYCMHASLCTEYLYRYSRYMYIHVCDRFVCTFSIGAQCYYIHVHVVHVGSYPLQH